MKRADFDASTILDQMSFDPASGYPVGDGLYYECALCGDVLASTAIESERCSCGNLVVDADSGRLLPRQGHGTVLVLHARPRRS